MNRTTTRTLLLLGAALLMGVPGGAAVSRAQDEAKRESKAGDTELAKHMEVVEEGMKKLRRSLRKPDTNAESLETLGKIQAATVASKSLTPAKAAKIPEAERQKFVTAYRKDMAKMLNAFIDMEVAVLDGDNAKAMEIHKKMKEIEDEGHKKYEE
jgi:hypothetical protein